jgi:hypothetical protein
MCAACAWIFDKLLGVHEVPHIPAVTINLRESAVNTSELPLCCVRVGDRRGV